MRFTNYVTAMPPFVNSTIDAQIRRDLHAVKSLPELSVLFRWNTHYSYQRAHEREIRRPVTTSYEEKSY